MSVAGPALIFLLGSIPVYWVLIILIEKGVCSCKKRSGVIRNDLVDAHETAGNALLQNNLGDEDVQNEEERIRNGNKDMPVRIDCVTKRYGDLKAINNLSFGLEYGECFALLGVSGAGKTSTFKSLTGVIKPD